MPVVPGKVGVGGGASAWHVTFPVRRPAMALRGCNGVLRHTAANGPRGPD